MTTATTIKEELDYRKQQLRAREGKDGYKRNCEELRARIAVLEIELALPKVEAALDSDTSP